MADQLEPTPKSYLTRLSLQPDDLDQSFKSDKQSVSWPTKVRRFTASHLKVLSVMALIAVVVATWVVMQARSVALDDSGVTPSVIQTSPASTPSLAQMWVVHVVGAVVNPGVVSVPFGARVIDAIDAAGGMTKDADPAELNLAATLVDGCQILVGTSAKPQGEIRTSATGSSGDSNSADGSAAVKISLNQATLDQLQTLPGVGGVTAKAILDWRNKNGQFTDLLQLQEIRGIGSKTFARLEPYLSL